MSIYDIARAAMPIITAQFIDICDIKIPGITNIDGQMVADPSSDIDITGVPCTYEPTLRSPGAQVMETPKLMSDSQQFKLLMECTASTMLIDATAVITVRARNERQALVFEQPVRLDEGQSPLLEVHALMRNQ